MNISRQKILTILPFFFSPFFLTLLTIPWPSLGGCHANEKLGVLSFMDRAYPEKSLRKTERKIQISLHYEESDWLTWSEKNPTTLWESKVRWREQWEGRRVLTLELALLQQLTFPFFPTHIKGSNPNAQCNKRNTFYWISARRGICQSKFKSLSVHHKLCESQVA